MKSILAVVLLATLATANRLPRSEDQTDSEYWNKLSSEALQASLQNKFTKVAKNVIIFLGDGMGISTVTAARTLRRQNEKVDQLGFETFPNVGLIKTYNVDYTVPDSAGTGTAFMSGVKTNKGVIGLNGKVKLGDEDCDNIVRNKVDSVLMQAIRSGVVTTTSLTDATPAAGYAHVSNRNYQSSIPITDKNCKDIARQLVEDSPGANFSVALGGGTRNFLPKESGGERTDGLDLFALWKENKKNSGMTEEEYKLVHSQDELTRLDLTKVKSLFGSFSSNHMAYEEQREGTNQPSLTEMTEAAIRVLSKNEKGFFLLVEGGNIDKAHHQNWAYLSLYDTLAFDNAIDSALNLVNLEETLIVVTADHSHGFTFNGYAKRDENIFGFAEQKDTQDTSYTSLLYATGPGFRTNRENETLIQTTSKTYRQLSSVSIPSAAHGGEDVAAYATGAMSHLMRSTQEQTYVAHIMTFAACVGPYQGEAHCKSNHASHLTYNCNFLILVCGTLVVLLNNFLKGHIY